MSLRVPKLVCLIGLRLIWLLQIVGVNSGTEIKPGKVDTLLYNPQEMVVTQHSQHPGENKNQSILMDVVQEHPTSIRELRQTMLSERTYLIFLNLTYVKSNIHF